MARASRSPIKGRPVGKFVYSTLVNTGVPGAWTPQGTWPVAYKQNPNLMKRVRRRRVVLFGFGWLTPAISCPLWATPYTPTRGTATATRKATAVSKWIPSAGAVVYGYDPVGTLVTVSSWVGPAQ